MIGGIFPAWASARASRARCGWKREGALYAAIPSFETWLAGEAALVWFDIPFEVILSRKCMRARLQRDVKGGK